MKHLLPILLLLIPVWAQSPAAEPQSSQGAGSSPSLPVDQENARKAKTVLEQAIQALGGQAYLTIRDMQQAGRGYSFHHGRPTSNGILFWRFSEYPNKERVELTKERDIAELYIGDKGYELTFKGPHPIEEKDLADYMRRRRFSLDTMLRAWMNDPTVALFYEGSAIAAEHPAVQVTLINSKNEGVTLYIDAGTHLPLKKTFTWRDPVDKQKNLEEEIYYNYRPVQGIMTPYGITRYFNGDMANERSFNSVSYNQGLDPAMFDPNSGYNPNKLSSKHK
jgi:hypothetical protein